MKNRLPSKRADITIIRVSSMIMIVLCHIIKFYTFIPGSSFAGDFLNVGVEVFFAMSGFLYGKKTIGNFGGWMKKRVQRIWVPVLIVVFIDTVLLAVIFDERTSAITEIAYILNLQGLLYINNDVFSNFITEIQNLAPLWFTTVIMICYLLLPLAQKFRNINSGRKNKSAFYAGCIIPLFIVSFLVKLTAHTTTSYILVFFSGYMLSDLEIDKIQYSKKRSVGYIIAIPVLVAIRLVLRRVIGGTALYFSYASLGHSMIGISLMGLGLEMNKRYPSLYEKIGYSKLFTFLDEASIYIYLVHGIFCFGTTSVYGRIHIIPATIGFVIITLVCAKLLWTATDTINQKFDCMHK